MRKLINSRSLGSGQVDRKGGSLVGLTFDLNGAVMTFDNSPGDRQVQIVGLIVGLVKRFEDMTHIFLGNARTAITDNYLEIEAHGTTGDPQSPAFRHRLVGVSDEVE